MRKRLKARYAVLAIGITFGLVQSSIGQSIFVDGSTTQWLQDPAASNMGMAAQGSLFTCRAIADVCTSRELPELSATESSYGFSQPLMMSYVPDVLEEGQPIELSFSVGRDVNNNLQPGQIVQTLLGNMTGNLVNNGKLTVHEIVATAYTDAASQTVASAGTPIVLSAGDSFDFGPHIQFGNESFSGPTLRTDFSVVVEFDQVMAGQTRVDVRYPEKDFTAGTSSAPWYYAGDSTQNGKFCTDDLTLVFQNQKYKTTLHAFWQDGDWDGAPVPASAPNPPGDELFNETDIIAAFSTGSYEQGCTGLAQRAHRNAGEITVFYNPSTGEVKTQSAQGTNLTSLLIKTLGDDFSVVNPAQNLGGPFDFRSSDRAFKVAHNNAQQYEPFGPTLVNFGSIAATGLSLEDFGEAIGTIFGVPNTHLANIVIEGDLNDDGTVDFNDIDAISDAILTGNALEIFDLNGDGAVDLQDHHTWVVDVRHTWIGDADLNGEFNSGDFVSVFSTGKYETGLPASWSEGDWNADGLFDSGDFVAAFVDNGYEVGQRPAFAVPEATSGLSLLFPAGIFAAGSVRRERRREATYQANRKRGLPCGDDTADGMLTQE